MPRFIKATWDVRPPSFHMEFGQLTRSNWNIHEYSHIILVGSDPILVKLNHPRISMAISGTEIRVLTIYKSFFLGQCKGISPRNMALYGTVPPF